ncbi:MAG: hypothetical protein ACRDIL_14550, partial [Candidatus Limnocylindrales bacterium]
MTHTTRLIAVRRSERLRRSRAVARRGSGSWGWPVLGTLVASTALAVGLAGVVSVSTLGVLSAGLPDPSRLEALAFAQPTIVYDRAGKVE